MSAALLERLETLGVKLILEQDRLKIDAPKGVLTPELKAELADNKPALVEALQATLVPEPIEPSPAWGEAISRAEALDPDAPYVVELFLLEYQDMTDVRFSRYTVGHILPNALKALSRRFPAAIGVEVAKPRTLEPLYAVGAPIPKVGGVRPAGRKRFGAVQI